MKSKFITFILLHVLLMMYSLSDIFAKLTSGAGFMSLKFIFCYGMVTVILGLYAIGWQQVIRRFPLTTAFANKAITIVWGIVWGVLFFNEKITIGKLAGAILVMAGVILFVKADSEGEV